MTDANQPSPVVDFHSRSTAMRDRAAPGPRPETSLTLAGMILDAVGFRRDTARFDQLAGLFCFRLAFGPPALDLDIAGAMDGTRRVLECDVVCRALAPSAGGAVVTRLAMSLCIKLRHEPVPTAITSADGALLLGLRRLIDRIADEAWATRRRGRVVFGLEPNSLTPAVKLCSQSVGRDILTLVGLVVTERALSRPRPIAMLRIDPTVQTSRTGPQSWSRHRFTSRICKLEAIVDMDD